MKLEFWQIFKNTQILNFMKNPSSGSQVDKAIVAFCNIANMPKNEERINIYIPTRTFLPLFYSF